MKYDASGQKPASTNGFDPGVYVKHIADTHERSSMVLETNLGEFKNEVLVGTFTDASPHKRWFQTALTIVQPVANRRS